MGLVELITLTAGCVVTVTVGGSMALASLVHKRELEEDKRLDEEERRNHPDRSEEEARAKRIQQEEDARAKRIQREQWRDERLRCLPSIQGDAACRRDTTICPFCRNTSGGKGADNVPDGTHFFAQIYEHEVSYLDPLFKLHEVRGPTTCVSTRIDGVMRMWRMCVSCRAEWFVADAVEDAARRAAKRIP